MTPLGWREVPIGALYRRRAEAHRPELPLLSVYRDLGVVHREGRGDNFNKPGEDLSSYQVVRPGYLVLNKMKTWQGSLGVSSFEGIVSPAYFVAEQVGDTEPRFMHHLLRSRPLIAEYGARSKGIRPNQWDLPWEEFRAIRVRLPGSSEQRALADYLDAETARIDALISRYLELVDRLVNQRGAITVAGVSGEPLAGPSRPSSLTWLTKVPNHWAEARLTLLARLGSGHTPSREHPEWWLDCTVPWITTGEVWQIRDDRIEYLSETREMISELGVANSSAEVHPAGTVVLSRTASAGYSAIMAADMATSQDYVTWTCGPRLRTRFLLLCLRAMRQDLLGRLAMGSTHQTIYVPDIQSIHIPLPPLEEQDRLVEWTWQRLRRIDAAIDAIRRQIELLAERRQALITAAVTGQLEIPGIAA